MPEIKMPENSDAVAAAANAIDAPCAVLLSVSPDLEDWQIRCFGRNDGFRVMAGKMAEVIEAAFADHEGPPDVDEILAVLGSPTASA